MLTDTNVPTFGAYCEIQPHRQDRIDRRRAHCRQQAGLSRRGVPGRPFPYLSSASGGVDAGGADAGGRLAAASAAGFWVRNGGAAGGAECEIWAVCRAGEYSEDRGGVV